VATVEEAQAIVEDLAGGADFANIARERSQWTRGRGRNGGDLGWFGEGMMVAPFEEGVMALAPGEVSATRRDAVRLARHPPERDPPHRDSRSRGGPRRTRGQHGAGSGRGGHCGTQETANISRIEPGQIDPSVIGNINLLEE
jgi:peptidyl-prolyl cis-trans isomerase C